ncbi:MAG: 1,4-alpha-glucan branching enzyme [Gammaproteobacteria bacterium]|nr:MAG: 1,4-alpha-glucan branching enzyme [Gammaproteobacteria bacterium]
MPLNRLQQGTHHDPFDYLGRHPCEGGTVVRAYMPSAEKVELVGYGPMKRMKGSDAFVAMMTDKQAAKVADHYTLRWTEKGDGSRHEMVSPYSFQPQIGELDLHLFNEGKHWQVWQVLGANMREIDGVSGCLFAVWAPAVPRVSVVGNFNGWNGRRHPMRSRGESGVWELFIPGLQPGDAYKYEILTEDGALLTKTDPYARRMALRPDTVSIIAAQKTYAWGDSKWIEQREHSDWQHRPSSAYEVHAGSWRLKPDGSFLSYRELADQLVDYVVDLGYTHIELMPVMEHPLDESWGYQVSGYYAPTSRFGGPDDFRYFVDRCHQAGLGVLLDWVPAHFPKDEFALARFIGKPLYEHADPKRGEHRDWGTLIFDYGRNEVRNFLIANALYWIEEFHIDGLRVDAVASMLYLDYSREDDDWTPNEFGGRENLEAIAFLKEMNEVVHARFPGALTVAEESTAWPMVSRPTYMGGLGFSMKWNMGWMHDTLSYMEVDPVYRKYHQDQLTFSQIYAYTENFVLPFSHDEVVHLKKSMLSKMPGDMWQQFANLRLLYAYQYAHPGKKLLFMGSEFGQWREWNAKEELDWSLLNFPTHEGLHDLVGDLNRLYREHRALHHFDFEQQGFQWMDCHDSEQSIISFLRRDDAGKSVICVFNFTPVVRESYRIGAPDAGDYLEILNTDSAYYGGSDVGNGGKISARNIPWMGFEHSLELRLPPLGALFLTLSRDQ